MCVSVEGGGANISLAVNLKLTLDQLPVECISSGVKGQS